MFNSILPVIGAMDENVNILEYQQIDILLSWSPCNTCFLIFIILRKGRTYSWLTYLKEGNSQ